MEAGSVLKLLKLLVESVLLRLSMITPEALIGLLCEIARLDGPNVHEHALILQVAEQLEIPPARYTALTSHTPVATLPRGGARH